MKRKLSLWISLLICVLLICGCSAKDKDAYPNVPAEAYSFTEEIKILKKEYPTAEFSVNGNELTMSYNIDFDEVAKDLPTEETYCTAITFDDLETLLDTVNIENVIIVRATKVGDSTQVCNFDSEMLCTDYYSNTPVKVLDTYYGDIEVGTQIVLKERAAVLTDADGTEAIWTFGLDPLEYGEEYILVLQTTTYNPTDIENYYSYVSICCGDFKIDENAKAFENREQYLAASGQYGDTLMADFLETYYIPGTPDNALNEAEECRKLIDYNIRTNGGDGENQELAALRDDKDATVEELRAKLSKEQVELVDRMIQKYGKK